MDRFPRFLLFIKSLPIGFVAAALGAATLSNVYVLMGFTVFRHVFFLFLAGVLLLFLCKALFHFSEVRSEYASAPLAAIYPTFFMGSMLFSGWLKNFAPSAAKLLLAMAALCYLLLMLYFFYRHLWASFSWDSFTPAYYVPCVGILVSCAAAPELLPAPVFVFFVVFGIGSYVLLIGPLIFRLAAFPYPKHLVHAKTVLIAPVSLSLVSLMNFPVHRLPVPQTAVFILYGVLLVSLGYVLLHLAEFFARPFSPGFAALTFPMAIASLASLRAAAYFEQSGALLWAWAARNMAGFQVFITSAFIGLVLYRFLHFLCAAPPKA